MDSTILGAEDASLHQENFLLFVMFSMVTLMFSFGVLFKFFTDDFHVRFRALLSLILLFIGEPICHFVIQGTKGLVLYTIACCLLYFLLPASHLTAGGQVVLIAGPYSRLLNSLLSNLHSKNIKVFVCLPKSNKDQALTLQTRFDRKIKVFVADLSSNDQSEFVQHQLRQELDGDTGLWGLVLLPAPLCNGPVMSSGSFPAQLHSHLAGCCNVVKALLPLMTRDGGRVIVATTTAARLPVPPTRHAAAVQAAAHEQLTHALRRELRPRGVRSALVWLPDDVSEHLLTSEETQSRVPHRQFSVGPDLVTAQALRAVNTALFSRKPRPTAACFLRDEARIALWAAVPTRLADLCQLGPYSKSQ